jgi:hypothetical protein
MSIQIRTKRVKTPVVSSCLYPSRKTFGFALKYTAKGKGPKKWQ